MKKVILLILDGWGWSREKIGNAILSANTPNINYLKENYPFFLLQASGYAVGLPPLKEGNSEVGHLTIGAGRIVLQHLTLINQAIKNGSFFENKVFLELINHVKTNNSKLNLMGLLTSGTVHASLEHLISIIKYLKSRTDIKNVVIHLFTDGKDSGKKESLLLLDKLEKELFGSGFKTATLTGRDFAMDRDNNWKLTQRAYNLLVYGHGERVENLKEALLEYHKLGLTDEIVPPTAINQSGSTIDDGDGVLFFNFREDNAKQLTMTFVDKDFSFFETKKFNNLFFATMTNYGENLSAEPIFKREKIKNTIGEILQNNGKKQLRIGETLKYAHVTYFFNGLKEGKFENETDILIPSLENYIEKPEMKTKEITEKIIEDIEKNYNDLVVANFANPDMLSHTGDFEATVRGIEFVDEAIGRIYQAAQKRGVTILITGDHGNAENLIYLGTGEKESRHNLSPVPLYIVNEELKKEKTQEELSSETSEIHGMLQDVTPTILKLMGIERPEEVTGFSLI